MKTHKVLIEMLQLSLVVSLSLGNATSASVFENTLDVSSQSRVLQLEILLVPMLPLVELIVANSREDKRRLGDQTANTVVVRDRLQQRDCPIQS